MRQSAMTSVLFPLSQHWQFSGAHHALQWLHSQKTR
jgi:hypothetical protein